MLVVKAFVAEDPHSLFFKFAGHIDDQWGRTFRRDNLFPLVVVFVLVGNGDDVGFDFREFEADHFRVIWVGHHLGSFGFDKE